MKVLKILGIIVLGILGIRSAVLIIMAGFGIIASTVVTTSYMLGQLVAAVVMLILAIAGIRALVKSLKKPPQESSG